MIDVLYPVHLTPAIYLYTDPYNLHLGIAANPSLIHPSPSQSKKVSGHIDRYDGRICFDYSTNDGLTKIIWNDIIFSIRFTKSCNTSIHIYKDGTNLTAIARLKDVQSGVEVDFHTFDSTSRVYTVHLGEHFMVRNNDGYFLLGRILSIRDDTRGDKLDEVCFTYSIDTTKSGHFKIT